MVSKISICGHWAQLLSETRLQVLMERDYSEREMGAERQEGTGTRETP